MLIAHTFLLQGLEKIPFCNNMLNLHLNHITLVGTVLRKDWLIFIKCFKDERTAHLHMLLHSWHYYKLKPEANVSSVELESELRNFLAVDVFLHFY